MSPQNFQQITIALANLLENSRWLSVIIPSTTCPKVGNEAFNSEISYFSY